jgi:hypothetical protein
MGLTPRKNDLLTVGWRKCEVKSEYEVGARLSPAYKKMSPEAEERPPLGAAAKKHDW